MDKWFAINHNGYLEYLGEHDIGDQDVEEYFADENMFTFIDEETARDYYETTRHVFAKKLYEVQTYTICDGWVNTWTDDDKPMVFNSKEEAQKELDQLINAMGYSTEDYRIVEV